MPDLSRQFLANSFHVVILEVEDGLAATGEPWWPIHACKWWQAFLEMTAESGAGADTLGVRVEHSHDLFVTGTFQYARFTNIVGNAGVVPTFQTHQADYAAHSDVILSHGDLTGALGSGANKIGTGAGEYFAFGALRAVSFAVGGGGVWSFRVHLIGQGQ